MIHGFTLIEVLIYIALFSFAVTSFVLFSLSVSYGRNKNYAVSEAQANARIVLEFVERNIRSAILLDIASSTFNADPGVLALVTASTTLNPTIIDLDSDDGRMRITQGTSSPVFITSNKVKVTRLIFQNLTGSSTRAHIHFDATVGYRNISGDHEYDYSQNIQSGASIRR